MLESIKENLALFELTGKAWESWAIRKKMEYLDSITSKPKMSKDEKLKFYQSESIYYQGKIDEYCKLLPGTNQPEREILIYRISDYQLQHSKYEQLLYLIKHPNKKCRGVSDTEIHAANKMPIENFLPNPVRRNMTKCFNHDDSNPSMRIKNNIVNCFVCGKAWDVIATVRQVNGLNFVDAVRYINNAIDI